VLWSTRYVDLAVTRLRQLGREVLPEDLARLSPLGFRHINFLGRYAFALPAEPGELRPLRDPDAAEDDEEAA
jgi:Tn3 transposase DDE domain